MSAPQTPPVRSSQPHFAIVAGLLLIACLILAWPWISGRVTVPWDAKAHFQAQLDFLAASLGSGDSPFWNPYVFSGWPQIADPQSLIFVPAFLILSLFDHEPSFVAMDATVYGELAFGGLCLAGYFRDRGWHMGGAMVAALSFAFGGSAAWRIQHTGQILSIAALPVVLFLLNRALQRRSFGWGLLAGIAAGRLAIGRDQVALLGIYFLVGFVIAHLFAAKPATRIARGIAPLVGGLIGGLIVAIVPVLLTYILAQESNRPSIDFMGAGIASMHPASFITLVNSDLFGMRLHDPKVDYWGPPSEAFKEFFSDKAVTLYIARNMAEVYAGMIPAFAILMWGVARGKLLDREIRYTSFALLIACLYTVGWYTPVFHWLYDFIPGVSLYRRPADATFLVGFLVAISGGWLVHKWLSGDWGNTTRRARIAQALIVVLVLGLVPYLFAWHADRIAIAIRPSVETIVIWAAALLVLVIARLLDRRSRLAATALLAAFTTADLAYSIAPNESTAASPAEFEAMQFGTKDPTIQFLKSHVAADATEQVRDRVELVGLGFHWPNVSMIQKLDNTLGYNPLRLKLYQDATGARDHVAIPEQRDFSAPLFPSYHSLMADLLGLKWIAVGVPVETIDKALKPGDLDLVSHEGNTWIYANPHALPRVLFVPDAKPADFAAIIKSGQWPDGFDPTKQVLLDQDVVPVPPGAPVDASVDLSHAARLTGYANTEIEIATDAPVAGYVVLNDVYHRWWHADIDGKPAAMLRANVIFRSVYVPAGKHVVRFAFHPFEGALTDLMMIAAHGHGAAPMGTSPTGKTP
jgi:hypothetical protein